MPKNDFEILKHGEFYVDPEEIIVCSECKSTDIDKNFQEGIYEGENLFFEKRQDYYLYKCNFCGCEFKRVVKTKRFCKIPKKKLIFGSMIAASISEFIAAYFVIECAESTLACSLIVFLSVISFLVLLFGIMGICGLLD